MKDKLVALIVNNGSCEFIANVKAIEQKELNKLKNECEEHKQKNKAREDKHLKEHEIILVKLHLHDILLAKSIFDNFVDKGLVETNEQFEKEWFDYMFNDCEFKIDNAPNEFKKILAKVGQ